MVPTMVLTMNMRNNPLPDEQRTIVIMFSSIMMLIAIGALLYFVRRHMWPELKAFVNSKHIGPIRKNPIDPFPDSTFYESTFSTSTFKVYALAEDRNLENGWNRCTETLREIVRIRLALDDNGDRSIIKKFKDYVPGDTRILAIRMKGFEFGEKCHEFVPYSGLAPGSYFLYQVFGDNAIQVINYVEDGRSYVAGLCVYVKNAQVFGSSYRMKYIRDAINSKKFEKGVQAEMEQERNTLDDSEDTEDDTDDERNHLWSDEKWIVKLCPKIKRKIMSKFKSGVVVHQEWNPNENQMKKHECYDCTLKYIGDIDEEAFSIECS